MKKFLLFSLFLACSSAQAQVAKPIQIPAGKYQTSWVFTDQKGPNVYTFHGKRGQWVQVSPGECEQETPCFEPVITAPSGIRVENILPESGVYQLQIKTINDQYSKGKFSPSKVEVKFQLVPVPPIRTRITSYEEGADYPGEITTPYGTFSVPYEDEESDATNELINRAVKSGTIVCVTPWKPYVAICQ